MSVVNGRVSFEASSSDRTAAWFTETVGVEPTESREIGDLVGDGHSGRRHRRSVWSLDLDFDDGDNPLDTALELLLARFDGLDDALAESQQWFHLTVRCFGSSSSTQGGFWVGPEVLGRMGRWGIEFHCTVYLEERPTHPDGAVISN